LIIIVKDSSRPQDSQSICLWVVYQFFDWQSMLF
jgi:hypothetical protein